MEWASTFSEYQSSAGHHPPVIVSSILEALRVLGLADPVFEPV